jgi:hypothetical protein
MWNKPLLAALALGTLWAGSALLWADEEHPGQIAKFISSATVTLQQGLTAVEAQGSPISAKFEVDEGHFQLSAYTTKADRFYEVVVDPATGTVVKSEAITGGEDLAEAKSQRAAMAKAKKSLKSAVDAAEKAAPGYRAVGVEPKIATGHAVASVALLQGTTVKTVPEALE